MKKPPYVDLYELPEDDRINLIAKMLLRSPGKDIAVLVDDAPKAERYLAKLRACVPDFDKVKVQTLPGPVSNTITIKLRYEP